MTKLHYFEEPTKAVTDFRLQAAIGQGYVPSTCLLNGILIMNEVNEGRDACSGCNGDRTVCKGRSKKS